MCHVRCHSPGWLLSPGPVGQGEYEIVNEISRGKVNKKVLYFMLMLDTQILVHLQRRDKAVLLSKMTFMPLLAPSQANFHVLYWFY